jgi:nitroreductase
MAITAETRELDPAQLDFYRELMHKDLVAGPRWSVMATWASNQVSIALGNFITAAAMLGVDTCAIEGFSPPDCDRELGLEDSPYRSCVVCAAGYRSSDDKYATLAKVRYPRAELIEHR